MDEIKHKFRDFLDKRQVNIAFWCWKFGGNINKNGWICVGYTQDRNMKIPSMGFTDHYTKKKSSTNTADAIKRKSNTNEVQSTTDDSILLNICAADDDDDDFNRRRSLLIPDQEILDSTEPIYFQENVDTGIYELNVSISV